MRPYLSVACLLVAIGFGKTAISHAQVRDVVVAPPGTATVEGTVVTDDAEQHPIHRATVTLVSGALGMPQSVVTDDAGSFVFTGVAAGNYNIDASKPPYVQAFYGAKRPGALSTGIPVAVLEHAQVKGIVIRLPRGAVITGALHYSDGRPASGVLVQISSIDVVNGTRREAPDTRGVPTDDRGIYRLYGLAAGNYIVMARPGQAFSALTGGDSTRQVSPEEIRWAQDAVAAASGTPGSSSPGPPPARGRGISYAPVYYPGSPDAANAALVTVGAGDERSGIDFEIAPVPTATVSGVVLGLDGTPSAGASIGLVPVSNASDLLSQIVGRLAGRPSQDGTFSLAGVTPGRYRLTARAKPPSAPDAKDAEDPMTMATALLTGGGSVGATLWGEEEVEVSGQDVSGLTIRLQNGLSVSGRVVVDTTGPAPDLTQMRVALGTTPAGSSPSDLAMSMMTAVGVTAAKDGTFRIAGLTPDRYRVTSGPAGLRSLVAMVQPGAADSSPGDLTLKSAMWQGQDLADVALDLKAGVDVSGLVVTLTDRRTQVSGTVRDSAGRPTPNFPIVAFSTNRAMWFAGSRRVQQARVLSDGKFTITGLPAGEYYVAALTDINLNELYEPSFLDSIVGAALKITLADGEKKTQDLKLAGG